VGDAVSTPMASSRSRSEQLPSQKRFHIRDERALYDMRAIEGPATDSTVQGSTRSANSHFPAAHAVGFSRYGVCVNLGSVNVVATAPRVRRTEHRRRPLCPMWFASERTRSETQVMHRGFRSKKTAGNIVRGPRSTFLTHGDTIEGQASSGSMKLGREGRPADFSSGAQ